MVGRVSCAIYHVVCSIGSHEPQLASFWHDAPRLCPPCLPSRRRGRSTLDLGVRRASRSRWRVPSARAWREDRHEVFHHDERIGRDRIKQCADHQGHRHDLCQQRVPLVTARLGRVPTSMWLASEVGVPAGHIGARLKRSCDLCRRLEVYRPRLQGHRSPLERGPRRCGNSQAAGLQPDPAVAGEPSSRLGRALRARSGGWCTRRSISGTAPVATAGASDARPGHPGIAAHVFRHHVIEGGQARRARAIIRRRCGRGAVCVETWRRSGLGRRDSR